VVGAWDGSRIEQVVTNMLANAIKYGRGQPIEVDVEAGPDAARLAVRDRGIGIAADEQARIFDPFHRAAAVHSYGGLGLGLYICDQIVRLHGGTLGVHSIEGEGSTFSIELPWGERT
jgi:signal transduction histidine kinase